MPGRLDPDERVIPRYVVGPGVFTIPHGPVRSGVFESVEYLVESPGEDIPHVQVRPFHKHRGLQKRFEGMATACGVLLAERVEGISSVAHALAYAHAIEDLAGVQVPPAAELVRLLHAELERIANHLDVVLRLCEAAGLAVAQARFGWHKERVLRLVGRLCASRFGRGVVVPGGVTRLPALPAAKVLGELDRLAADVDGDRRALMVTASFLDRLRTTGPLPVDRARTHGALGPVGRGSGAGEDVRWSRPYDAYRRLAHLPGRRYEQADALARLNVRWDEMDDAFHLVRLAVDELDALGAHAPVRIPASPGSGRGLGWAEAAQGEVLYVVDVEGDRIVYCKPRSASFHNLALFASTFAGDILTDFPFIEASFGLSIAGVVV
jgi:Ni,Fe-hydrogenase III large subunit